jgi:hypothetical protein
MLDSHDKNPLIQGHTFYIDSKVWWTFSYQFFCRICDMVLLEMSWYLFLKNKNDSKIISQM